MHKVIAVFTILCSIRCKNLIVAIWRELWQNLHLCILDTLLLPNCFYARWKKNEFSVHSKLLESLKSSCAFSTFPLSIVPYVLVHEYVYF